VEENGLKYNKRNKNWFGLMCYIRGRQTFSAEDHIENFSATGGRIYIFGLLLKINYNFQCTK